MDSECNYCDSVVSTERTCFRCDEKFNDVLNITEKQMKCDIKDHREKAFHWGLGPHLCPSCDENYYMTGGCCNPPEVHERTCSCNSLTINTFCFDCQKCFDYIVQDDEKSLINDHCQFEKHHIHQDVRYLSGKKCPNCL